MNSPALLPARSPKYIKLSIFVLGVVGLIVSWFYLYLIESWFTESHLAGYYCCVTELDLPAPGTLQRTVSDFFHHSPGAHLPSLNLVVMSASFFVASIRRASNSFWWLPFLFIALSILYLLVDGGLVSISWLVSELVEGPRPSAYRGYDRTWYGIVLHLMLWGGFFFTLSRIPLKLLPELGGGDRA